MNRYQLVLFDFDGTIADTAGDMINALNLLLKQKSMPLVDYDELRPHVSNGTPALLRCGFDCSPGDAEFDGLRREFLDLYERNLCDRTVLYPGTVELLDKCRRSGIAWGIVTNKPEHLTRQIVHRLGLANQVTCIVGGDTLTTRKPDPAPVIFACEQAAVPPHCALFVGDSWRDIEAGRGAELTTVGVTYGYIPPDDNPIEWGADFLIDSIVEVGNILWMEKRGTA